jgi:tryptophan synthase alpha chain
MKRIEATFRRLAEEGRGALIPFMMAGDPDPSGSAELAVEILRAGADILELGIPFSDPVADGPVIQRAGQRALESGTGLREILWMVERIREKSQAPLVLMTYYNPVYLYGEEHFIREAVEAGADALLMVDLPPEEGAPFFKRVKRAGLDSILMVTPTTTGRREGKILDIASGFIYCVSRRGTTGARRDIPEELREKVAGIKERTDLPVAVGFGISTRDQVGRILSLADGAIIGSALISALEGGKDLKEKLTLARRFIEGMGAF